MAHKFHGIVPGKKKQEKLQRKRQEEMKLKHAANDDNLARAFRNVQEETGSAHLVLAVGNKNAAPSQIHAGERPTGRPRQVSAAPSEGSQSVVSGQPSRSVPTHTTGASGFQPLVVVPNTSATPGFAREKVFFNALDDDDHDDYV